jgi:hypothetical protein
MANPRLTEMARRHWITYTHAEAGSLWASDMLEVQTQLRHYRGLHPHLLGHDGSQDVMRIALRNRLRAAEAALAGQGSPLYRIVHHVVVKDGTVGEIATKLGIRTTSAGDMLRLGLDALIRVYQL